MTQQPSDPFATSAPTPITTPVVAPVAVRRRSTPSRTFTRRLAVVAVGGVAFAAGRATAPVATTTGRGGFTGNGGAFGGNGFGPNASGAPGRGGLGGTFAGGGLTIQGTVTAVTADSITLQLASGQSITIPTDSGTTYHTRAVASASDVTTGSTVLVQLNGGRGGTGQGGQDGGPAASGAPNRGTGSASSVTVVPAGS